LNPSFVQRFNRCVFYDARCRLCKFLQEERKKRGPPIQTGANRALQLVNSYLQVERSEGIIMREKYTIAAWVKFSKTNWASQRIVDRVAAGTLNGFNLDLFAIENMANSPERNYFVRLCAGIKCMTSIRYLRPLVWNHIAVTFDSSVIDGVQFYVNGNHDSTYTSHFFPTLHLAKPMTIGATSDPPGKETFSGVIDDISLWSIALNKTQIRKLLFQKLAGDEIGLELYYDFNNPAKDVVKDVSINSRNARQIGFVYMVDASHKPMYVTEYD